MPVRYGRQTPTYSVVLKYKRTKGGDALKLYSNTGRKAQEWQKTQVNNIMACDKKGIWVHTKYGYTVPRRNGKTEVIMIRELYALRNGEKVLHTAHRVTTSSATAARLARFLQELGYKEVQRVKKGEKYTNAYTYAKQVGQEKITLLDEGGGEINFRTRTAVGGLGEGYDLLVIDEAQEYTEDQQNTLQFVVSDSANPQIIMCGTPPTAVSKGTVFTNLRNNVRSGQTEDTGWAEWSVEHKVDVNDVEMWYECNPAMGYQLNERKIRAEDKSDENDYNIQRFGWFADYNQQSVITKAEWEDLTAKPEPTGKLSVGIKYGQDGINVAMGIAVKTKDKRIYTEVIDCRPLRDGTAWIINFLKKSKNVSEIVIDGANGQGLLQKDLKDFGIKTKTILPAVKEVIVANAQFENAIFQQTICHNNQPSLSAVVTNCDKRNIGTGGGFGYRSLSETNDVVLMDSIILAHWACLERKETVKQRISY